MRFARGILVSILVVGAVTSAPGQEMAVPTDVQYTLLMKVFVTVRGFSGRIGEELVIGIVYQPKFRRSVDAKDALVDAVARVSKTPLESIPIRTVACALDGESDAAAALADTAIDLLYIAPLRAFDVGKLTEFSNGHRLMTCTGVPAYVRDGVTVGIDAKGSQPQILINLAAAKTEQIEFPHQLLQLSSVSLINLSSVMRR